MESNQKKPVIRFAVMGNSAIFPEWQAQCLRRLLELENVAVVLFISNDSATSKSPFQDTHGISPLLRLYLRLIARPRSLRPVDLSGALSDVPTIKCKTVGQSKSVDYFSEEDVGKIKQFDLDFILQFGFSRIRGGLLGAARYGVWAFHHDEVQRFSGTPPCFWEIYNRQGGVLAVLERLTTDQVEEATSLRRGFLPAIAHSYASTLDLTLFESSTWPAQVCIDIANGNTEYLDAPPCPTASSPYLSPANLQMLLFPLKLASSFLRRTYDHLFRHEEWNIGIIRQAAASLLAPDANPEIHWFPNPKKGRYLADPFAISHDQKIYILCEDFDYGPLKAVISSIELANSGSITKKEVGIREPFHLSYPYVFSHDDAFYCVPEASQTHGVMLYKAVEFPWRWERVCTLIKDFPGVDSTVFKHEGRWWLTCTNAEDGKNHKLFIWHASNFMGPWEPHALNPVKFDVRSARPGGTPFVHNGCLYRPAQDCSQTYGGRLVLNRVLRLTPTAFDEEPVRIIGPDRKSRYPDGLHTLSAMGDITVVDGKRHFFLMKGFLHAVLYMLRVP